MTNWELNYDIILVFQTNHGSFKLLKGNTSCDLKILKFCDIFRCLVSSFLCLFGIVYCIWLTVEQMAEIFASECCSDGGGSRIPQLQQTIAKSNSDWKASMVVFLSCTGNQPTTLCMSRSVYLWQDSHPLLAMHLSASPCGTCGRWRYRES